MSELSANARALLEAARRGHGPSEEDRERVLTGLHASLGIGVALPTLVDSSAVSASTSGTQLVPPVPPAPLAQAVQTAASPSSLGWSKLFAWKAGKVWLASLVIGGGALGLSALPRGQQASETLSARKSAASVAPFSARAPEGELGRSARAPEGASGAERATDTSEPSLAMPSPAARDDVAPPAADTSEHGVAPEDAPRADEVEPGSALATHEVSARQRTSAVRTKLTRHEHRLSARMAEGALRHSTPTAEGARRHTRRSQLARERELLAQKPVVAEPSAEPSAQPPVAPAVAPPPSPELALIRAALTSLRDHQPTQALRLLDEHAARYPNGAFSTERRALHAIAQCASGHYEEGARERAQFLATSGSSPIAARVRNACPR